MFQQNGNGHRNGTLAAPRVHPDFSFPTVDKVYVEERAAALGKRSIKKATKVAGLEARGLDDGPHDARGEGHRRQGPRSCARRPLRPLDADPTRSVRAPPSACTRTSSPIAKEALAGSTVKVASVATAFPSGLSPLASKLDDVRRAVEFGADEIDMVIDRGAMLVGRLRARSSTRSPPSKRPAARRTSRSSSRPASSAPTTTSARRSEIAMRGRRRLHQDVDRQDPARRDAARHAGDARGDPRLLLRDRPAASA